MDIALRDDFLGLWAKYFDSASLPVAFYFTNDDSVREFIRPPKGQACVVGQLAHVRGGETLAFDRDAVGCFGGKKFLGFSTMLRPGFEYFLSYGIPDKMEGERYKKSPEIVREMMKSAPVFQAPGKYIVFKRWDALAIADEPAVVIFFERPDVISGPFYARRVRRGRRQRGHRALRRRLRDDSAVPLPRARQTRFRAPSSAASTSPRAPASTARSCPSRRRWRGSSAWSATWTRASSSPGRGPRCARG